jgi:hypothetical protein
MPARVQEATRAKGQERVMKTVITPTDTERFFDDTEIIVSKTDLKGRLTYVNETFCKIADYIIGVIDEIARQDIWPLTLAPSGLRRLVIPASWNRLVSGAFCSNGFSRAAA